MRRLRRKAWLALLGAALIAAGAVAVVFATAGGSQPGVPLVAGIRDPVQAADRTLSLELRSENLSVQDVACVRNGRTYQGNAVIRCNVNFGDPHVVAYCSVIVAGRLITSHQDPSIPCQPDLVDSKPLLYSSSP
jgi:hypothetical protein